MIVIGNLKAYEKVFQGTDVDSAVLEAIREYVSSGGVIKLESVTPMKIAYPSRNRLKAQLDEVRAKKRKITEEMRNLRRKQEKGKKALRKIKVIADPLYWKHRIKLLADPGYRKAYETVEMPVAAMTDPKHRKMVEMFVTNPEYRERLVEARTSVIGRSRGSIRESVEKSDKFKEEVISERLGKLEKELEKYERREKALNTLLQFSSKVF